MSAEQHAPEQIRDLAATLAPAWGDPFLATLLERIPVGVVACDRRGVILIYNEEAQRIHPLISSNEFSSWSDYAIHQPDGVTRVMREELPLIRALLGESVRSTHLVIAPPGRTARQVLVDAEPVRGATDELLGAVALITDVTAAREAEMRAKEAEERFRLAFEHAPIGIALVDTEGRWLRVNRALCDLTGYDEPDLLARSFNELMHHDDIELHTSLMRDTLAGARRDYQLDKRWLHARGHVLWVHLSVSLVREADGGARYFIAQVLDITDRKQREGQLRRLAQRDSLTGVLVRWRFEQELDSHLARAERYGPRGALLMLDVDGLKGANDRYGHAAGDRLLRGVARTIRDRLRSSDVVGRLGGDEFAVLLPEADRAAAEEVAAQLVGALRRRRVDDESGPPTASVGIAVIEEPLPSASELRDRADRAMYTVKRCGGDGWATDATAAPRRDQAPT